MLGKTVIAGPSGSAYSTPQLIRVLLFAALRIGLSVTILTLPLQAFGAGANNETSVPSSNTTHPQGGPTSLLSEYRIDRSPKSSRKLPKALTEISGLALTPDGRLLGHDDEQAIVYQLDVGRGKIVKSFHLGNRPVVADFEGIAVTDEHLYLVTSAGVLFETSEGDDGESVDFERIDSGIGEYCEVEGLEFDRRDRMLLLACKNTRGSRLEDFVVVFRWSLVTRRLEKSPPIKISKREIERSLSGREFHPSGIAIHPVNGHLFLIAAREQAILEVTRDGVVTNGMFLKAKRHGHPEGIAIGVGKNQRPDLLISDEGGDHRARITRYRMRKAN